MNNSWKLIGGIGAGLGAVLQLNSVYQALEWGGEHVIVAVLYFISYAAIATGFFMAQNGTTMVTAPVESASPQVESASPQDNNGDIPSVGQWLGWMLLLSIPLVNFILMIMWAIDKKNQIRRNWTLSIFILYGVVLVLYVIATVLTLIFVDSYY